MSVKISKFYCPRVYKNFDTESKEREMGPPKESFWVIIRREKITIFLRRKGKWTGVVTGNIKCVVYVGRLQISVNLLTTCTRDAIPSTNHFNIYPNQIQPLWRLTLILRRSRTGTVWFYTSTSNKRAARPKLYTKSLTRDLKLMYCRLKLVRISIKL